jgi:hypothetical protein
VAQFTAAQGRVDGDDGDPGERGPVLEQDPFRPVVGPDRDLLAGGEPLQQRGRGALGVRQQLAVGPAPPGRGIGGALHQSGDIGRGADRLPQRLADAQPP